MSTLKTDPDSILAQLRQDPKWVAEQRAFKRWSRDIDVVIADMADRAEWWLLEFTPEVMAIQCGDPDIAFQCELDGYVLRADYVSECGPCSFYWQPGLEEECLEKFEFFGHGTPSRRATAEEMDKYGGWLMRAAFLKYAADHVLPPYEPNYVEDRMP